MSPKLDVEVIAMFLDLRYSRQWRFGEACRMGRGAILEIGNGMKIAEKSRILPSFNSGAATGEENLGEPGEISWRQGLGHLYSLLKEEM